MDHQRNIATPAARKFVLSRGLPKTGQLTSYNAGDDGDLEAGWWRGRLNANNKTRYRLIRIAGDDVISDLATALMWAAVGNAAGCNNGNTINWASGIAYATNLNFAAFTDWRMPNLKELLSIVEYDAALWVAVQPVIQQPPFSFTIRDEYWTSTALIFDSTRAQCVDFSHGHMAWAWKTGLAYLRCVRKGL